MATASHRPLFLSLLSPPILSLQISETSLWKTNLWFCLFLFCSVVTHDSHSSLQTPYDNKSVLIYTSFSARLFPTYQFSATSHILYFLILLCFLILGASIHSAFCAWNVLLPWWLSSSPSSFCAQPRWYVCWKPPSLGYVSSPLCLITPFASHHQSTHHALLKWSSVLPCSELH